MEQEQVTSINSILVQYLGLACMEVTAGTGLD